MAENKDIWVFSEKPDLLAELISGGRALAEHTGGKVIAIVLGPRSAAEQAIQRGADEAAWLGEQKEGYLVDDYLQTLASLLDQQPPYALLFGSTRRGKALAGRLGGRLRVTVLTDVLEFQFEGDALRARHMIFGGGAVRVDQPVCEPILATVGPGVFEAQAADGSRSGPILEVPFLEPDWRATLRERKTRPAATVNLAAAKRVVCSGRGLARQEDLSMVNELARLLGAEVACTRPLAEGLDWLPRERYIGISGATVKPELYFGVGVSGQVQHQIGMNDSRVVVAVNKDRNAPIFANADYGITGDLYAFVPALIEALKGRNSGGR